MSRPRFLADHDLNEHIIAGIKRREPIIEIVRAREAGMDNRPDSEVLEYGVRHGLILVSHDVNTMPAEAYRRLAANQPMAGLLMVQQTEPVSAVIEELLLIWSVTEAEEWQNQVCFLPLA